MMFIHVTAAKYVEDYRVQLSFNDGSNGEVFEPLKDKSDIPHPVFKI